jgi:hypothetical protein
MIAAGHYRGIVWSGLSIAHNAATRGLSVVGTNRHAEAVGTCPLLGEERKSLPTIKMTAFDPDCVKTRASQERAELFSQ